MTKLWYRNAVISPLLGFMDRVRYETPPAGDPPPTPPAGGAGDPPAPGQPPAKPPAGEPPAPAPATDWRSGLDAEIKDHPCLKDFKSEKDAIKAYVNAQKLIGLDKLPLPPKDAKPEVKAKFMDEVADRLGRPAKPEEYKLTDPKLPDGVKVNTDPNVIKGFKEAAYKAGMLPHQVEAMYQLHMNMVARAMQEHNAQTKKTIEDATATLRNEWGAAFDTKKALAENVLDKFASPEAKAHLVAQGFNNDPVIIKILADFGAAISEDSFVRGGEVTMTPSEAKDKLLEIQGDTSHPYWNETHPEHAAAVERYTQLYRMANPDLKK